MYQRTSTMSYNKHLSELIKSILKLKNQDEVFYFLKWILTPKELKQLPARLQIVKMLKAKVPQRQIAKKLGVGIATITRGTRELQKNPFIGSKQ